MRFGTDVSQRFDIQLHMATTESTMEEEEPVTLLDLPDGCLLRVVNFLAPTDVCKLQTCSKRWQYICKDNQLWSKFLNDVYDLRLEVCICACGVDSNPSASHTYNHPQTDCG